MAEQEVKEGQGFTVEVAPGQTIEDVRKQALARFGREIHIRAKIGPTEISGNKLECPLEAVDDQCLAGVFNQWPQKPEHFLLVGYFK